MKQQHSAGGGEGGGTKRRSAEEGKRTEHIGSDDTGATHYFLFSFFYYFFLLFFAEHCIFLRIGLQPNGQRLFPSSIVEVEPPFQVAFSLFLRPISTRLQAAPIKRREATCGLWTSKREKKKMLVKALTTRALACKGFLVVLGFVVT